MVVIVCVVYFTENYKAIILVRYSTNSCLKWYCADGRKQIFLSAGVAPGGRGCIRSATVERDRKWCFTDHWSARDHFNKRRILFATKLMGLRINKCFESLTYDLFLTCRGEKYE
jgi:hypothetical protein